jgi:hypothetical protein
MQFFHMVLSVQFDLSKTSKASAIKIGLHITDQILFFSVMHCALLAIKISLHIKVQFSVSHLEFLRWVRLGACEIRK